MARSTVVKISQWKVRRALPPQAFGHGGGSPRQQCRCT